jgi:multicomponent Na+:H+ antiporter subunit G
MNIAFDIAASAFLLTGSLLALIAAVGMWRFPDVLSRMHAATKPQVLGLTLIMIGTGIRLRNSVDVWMLVLAATFQIITAPVAMQLVGRLSYRRGSVDESRLIVDDLRKAENAKNSS